MNGLLPFENDTYISDEILSIKQKFNIYTAIETGSQYGSSLKWFMDNFHEAFGCEPNKNFFDVCFQKNLILFNEKSTDFLPRFKDYEGLLIFIDSHWRGEPCPLKEELEIISMFKNEPVICIHDFKVPERADLGYDVYDFELSFEEIEDKLKKIYRNGFDYHYNDKADGAKRGVIYIYPKTK